MRPWIRYGLYLLGAVVLVLAAGALWLATSFDAARFQRSAIDWMRSHQQRELSFAGPVGLQLWPQPAITLQGVRLSEAGQPDRLFAAIDHAVLSLHLRPLLERREIAFDRIAANGVKLRFERSAEGRRNIDDLLLMAAGDGKPEASGPSRQPLSIDHVELGDAELHIDDALTGVHGRLAVQSLSLGQFGPGQHSPLVLHAQAELQRPPLNGRLMLQASVELLPPLQPGAAPRLRLDKTDLRLQGDGDEFKDVDLQIDAGVIHLDYGSHASIDDGHVELEDLKLRFSGRRLSWQVDSGSLALARLRLDVGERKLKLERLVLSAKGHRGATTLDAQLQWPALEVLGDNLQGGPVQGHLALAGDQKLQLQLRSKAPSGGFERITLPQLRVDVDGRLGTGAIKGQAEATLVLEPAPRTASLDAMTLTLQIDDPSLPPLQLKLGGSARVSPVMLAGQVQGTLNDQRVDARIDAKLRSPRSLFDIDARFGSLDLNRFVAADQRSASADAHRGGRGGEPARRCAGPMPGCA